MRLTNLQEEIGSLFLSFHSPHDPVTAYSISATEHQQFFFPSFLYLCRFLPFCDPCFVSNRINQYSDHSTMAQTEFWELSVLGSTVNMGWEFGMAGVRLCVGWGFLVFGWVFFCLGFLLFCFGCSFVWVFLVAICLKQVYTVAPRMCVYLNLPRHQLHFGYKDHINFC